MTIVRVGSNSKYAEGWEAAFKGKKNSVKPAAPKGKAAKASTKKKAGGKKKGKKK